MTHQQFERMRDVALRMARTQWRLTERRRARLVADLEEFFAAMARPTAGVPWYAELGNWDGDVGGRRLVPLCDAVHDYWERNGHWHTEAEAEGRFARAVLTCIRTGADMAIQQSGGVVGFTVGTLRAMYPEGLPDWLREDWTPAIEDAPDDAPILL